MRVETEIETEIGIEIEIETEIEAEIEAGTPSQHRPSDTFHPGRYIKNARNRQILSQLIPMPLLQWIHRRRLT
jgi:hypothetical protein